MKKVLIADKMSIQAEKVFTANGISFDKKIGLSEEAICEIVNEYEGIVVRSATKITKKIIQSGEKLKVLGRAGIGVDNIDIEAATNYGIVVMNTPPPIIKLGCASPHNPIKCLKKCNIASILPPIK